MPASIPESAAATAASSVTGGDVPTPHTVKQMVPDPKWIPLESNPEVSLNLPWHAMILKYEFRYSLRSVPLFPAKIQKALKLANLCLVVG
jgi:hypothetical protein